MLGIGESLAWGFSVPTTVDVDLSGLVPITIMIVSALCVVWVGKKLIRLFNRS